MKNSRNSFFRKKTKTTPVSSRVTRIRLLFLVFVATATMLVLRMIFLQVIDHEKWSAVAENQHTVSQDLIADRGEVYIHDGENLYPLAVNREYQTLYVSPKDVVDKYKTTVELARILNMDTSLIEEKVNIPDDPFEIIKKRLTDDERENVKALHLPGVSFLSEKYRYYPAGQLASQVVGFVGSSENEKSNGYGIEASKNEILQGESGAVSQEKDASGRWLPLSDREMISPKNGENIVLTIDRVVQYETEKILQESVELYGADSATAIVMEPQTGNILSMASFPQFDPNTYGEQKDYSIFLNPSVSSSYEPGSIMKPLTMAIGIEEEKVSPSTEYVDTGAVSESGYVIHNAEEKVYGRSTMTHVLDMSINTGVIFVEKLVGNKIFGEYLKNFGFGEKTGVGLPAELSGNIKNLENPRATLNFFTASFGQGITATPLQMVTAYAVLANGGNLMKPRIIDSTFSKEGEQQKTPIEVIRRVVGEDTSRALGKMLRSVVVNGHGKRADVPGYLVGGKTGTAQVAKSGSKGYEEGLTIGSFVGYAPINDPKFVVLVKLDNPKNVEWAESSAAPAFGRIMKFLLEYAKIQPTEIVSTK